MPILKNSRYDEFENPTARDSFRGVPHRRFPWLLQETTVTTGSEKLVWTLRVSCLNVNPSGFGNKMHMVLQATAELTADSARAFAFPDSTSPRVEALFGQADLNIEESLKTSVEGLLDDLGQYASAFARQMTKHLAAQWSSERVRSQLRAHLSRTSPGGFGANNQHA